MNILLTSIGRRDYLVSYFKKSIQNRGKLFVSNSTYSSAFELADGSVKTPLIYENNYISFIIDFCKRNNIKAVMSVFDIDLLILSKNNEQFIQEGITLILAPLEFVEICNDKWLTYQFLKNLKIGTPKSFNSLKETKEAIINEDIKYPIFLKPRWGMASIGVYKIYDEEELDVITKRCLREISETHLKYESASTPENQIIFQEFLDGQEYGMDIVTDLTGKYVETFVKKKISMRSGETDLGETVANCKFEEISRKITAKSKHQAILSVDMFVTESGVFVTEMNCRISGHYPLSHLAGVDLPTQIIDWLENKPTNLNLLKMKEGVKITKVLNPTIIKM